MSLAPVSKIVVAEIFILSGLFSFLFLLYKILVVMVNMVTAFFKNKYSNYQNRHVFKM